MTETVLVTGRMLIDGTGAEPLGDGGVVYEDGEIIAAGPRGELPAADRQINATEKTILPGFVDAHCHLTYTALTLRGGIKFYDEKNSLEYNTIGAVENADINLQRGVTTIRDIGSRGSIAVAIRDAVKDGIVPGPRIVASGPVLCTTGGLLDMHPNWIDAKTGYTMKVDTADEAVKAVRRQAKMGVDNIKLEASGEWVSPFSTSETPTMRREVMEAAVEVAHDRGLSVAAHAKAAEAIKRAVRAGVDTIEHGTYLDEEAIDLLLENEVPLVGTLAGQTDIAENAIGTGQPPELVEQVQKEIETLRAAVRRAHEAGVTVIIGTDSGPPHSSHGNVGEEIVHLVETAGFSPMDAIIAGTKEAAAAIGMGDAVGTLVPGKLADFVVVDGDPLDDIRVLKDPERIDRVIKGGIEIG